MRYSKAEYCMYSKLNSMMNTCIAAGIYLNSCIRYISTLPSSRVSYLLFYFIRILKCVSTVQGMSFDVNDVTNSRISVGSFVQKTLKDLLRLAEQISSPVRFHKYVASAFADIQMH